MLTTHLKMPIMRTVLLWLFSAFSLIGAGQNYGERAYAFHYRSVDSVEAWARKAYAAADDGGNHYSLLTPHYSLKAEALNHLAFAAIQRMEYGRAEQLLASIKTHNSVERLICEIQQMRLCQRRAHNRDFHLWREKALATLRRIHEEKAQLSAHGTARLRYAESELALVASTYYYYVGQERQAAAALGHLPEALQADTAQWLATLYHAGSGGIIHEATADATLQKEFEQLVLCFCLARQGGYTFFVANAREAIAEQLLSAHGREILMARNAPALEMLNPQGVAPEELPLYLAKEALKGFQRYGDVYQTAGALRTIASCYMARGYYQPAVETLHQALSDTLINQAPDLVASIHEQLSVAYAGLNQKGQSDYHRNIYLDLQQQTRQDRLLEARARTLDSTVGILEWLTWAVIAAIVLLALLLWWVNRRTKSAQAENLPTQTKALEEWEEAHAQQQQAFADEMEEWGEQVEAKRLAVEHLERMAVEGRAKLSLTRAIAPLVDRLVHEVEQAPSPESHQYIGELVDQIDRLGEVLTRWIQLRQGALRLHVETFALQDVLDVVSRAQTAFRMKGVTLVIKPTDALVKADRVLTLFMINTLADNARKATPEGGTVTISAEKAHRYVEVSIADTGSGISEATLKDIFSRKTLTEGEQQSHGFGLLNCRGIIERYRKTSALFAPCLISAESKPGHGSRFFFRLPYIIRMVCALILLWPAQKAVADESLSRAAIYADSAYFSNINGTYARTLLFADSCRWWLNQSYKNNYHRADTLIEMGNEAAEIEWFRRHVSTNFNLILDLRNESAVAALALHQWELYRYNNRIYTQLFKEMSADHSLDSYCRTMLSVKANRQTGIVLLVLLLLSMPPIWWLRYYRHRLRHRTTIEQLFGAVAYLQTDATDEEKLARLQLIPTTHLGEGQRALLNRITEALGQSVAESAQHEAQTQALDDELRRLTLEEERLHVESQVLECSLSTLKHETMYYPARLRQLLLQDQPAMMREVAAYYGELYGQLCRMANRQAGTARLHIAPLDHGILADRNLLDYLLEIIRKETHQKELHIDYSPLEGRTVMLTISIPPLTPQQGQNLFSFDQANYLWQTARQIVRDIGEATGRHRCGISAETTPQGSFIKIIIPAKQ